jgi:dipeptidyl aminopeptidase/acylaminoacyl peptidase
MLYTSLGSYYKYVLLIVTVSSILTILLTGCAPKPNEYEGIDGIQYLVPRGHPPISSVNWATKNENLLLISAAQSSLSNIGSYVYIYDIESKKIDYLAQSTRGVLGGETWFPFDNKVVVYIHPDTRGYEKSGLWIVDLNRRSWELLADGISAAWSPDGKKIAAVIPIIEGGQQRVILSLQVIDLETRERQTIYKAGITQGLGGLTWSNDSQFLAFSKDNYVGHSIYIINIQTKELSELTNKVEDTFSPSWSPRGKVIAYVKFINENDRFADTLHLINYDGSCDIEIPGVEGKSPTWSPDGKRIAFVASDGVYIMDVEKVMGRDINDNLCPFSNK